MCSAIAASPPESATNRVYRLSLQTVNISQHFWEFPADIREFHKKGRSSSRSLSYLFPDPTTRRRDARGGRLPVEWPPPGAMVGTFRTGPRAPLPRDSGADAVRGTTPRSARPASPATSCRNQSGTVLQQFRNTTSPPAGSPDGARHGSTHRQGPASFSARARFRCVRKCASRPEWAVKRSRLAPVRKRCPPVRLVMQAPSAKKSR
jgi:hypothetical protein